MDPDTLFTAAEDLWGVRKQDDMLQEECGELVAAINQWRRGRKTFQELLKEIADVDILIRQFLHNHDPHSEDYPHAYQEVQDDLYQEVAREMIKRATAKRKRDDLSADGR